MQKRVSPYSCVGGKVIYREGLEVPPPDQRVKILQDIHENLGHKGSRSIREMAVQSYTWKGMKQMAEDICEACVGCQTKGLKPIVDPVLHSIPLPDFLARGVMDMIGPYPESRYGNKMVATYQDSHSKWAIAKAMPNKEPTSVCKFLKEEVIFGISPPLEIMCDNGGEFYAEVETMCRKYGIKMTRGAAYHPQTQGQIERTNKTLQDSLKACMTDQPPDSWEDHLPECVAGMNFSKQRSTGFSPFQIMHGIAPRLPIGMTETPDESTWADEDKEVVLKSMSERTHALNQAHPKLVANVGKAQARQAKEYASRRETKTSLPPIGTLVWIRKERRTDGKEVKSKKKDIGKQHEDWAGPFKLIGYTPDKSRAIVCSPASDKTPSKEWSESWKDVRIKKSKKN